MYKKFKHFMSYSCFGVLSSLVGFLSVPYLTRSLSAEEYGIVGLFMSLLFFIVPALSFSSEGLIGIKKVNDGNDGYQNFIDHYFTVLFILTAFTLIFGSLCVFIFGNLTNLYLVGLILPFVGLLQALSRVHSVELVQDKRPKAFGIYTLSTALLLFSVTYLGVTTFELGWFGRVVALMIAEFIMLFVKCNFTFSSFTSFKPKFSKNHLLETFKFGFPLIFLLFASWVLNEADRIIVFKLLSLSDVGIYTASYSLGLAMNVINNAMTNTMVPVIYNIMKEKKGLLTLRKLTFYYSIFIFILSTLSAVFFYHFGSLILGENYADGVMITCVILISFGFNGMYRTVGLPLDYLKLNILKTINFSLCAIVNITLSIFMFDRLGILSPAVGTLISFVLLYLLTLYYNFKHTRFLSE